MPIVTQDTLQMISRQMNSQFVKSPTQVRLGQQFYDAFISADSAAPTFNGVPVILDQSVATYKFDY